MSKRKPYRFLSCGPKIKTPDSSKLLLNGAGRTRTFDRRMSRAGSRL